MDYILSNTYMVDSQSETKGSIRIKDSFITYKEKTINNQHEVSLNNDYFVYPSFINAHDHLMGSYYPRVGTGHYTSWLPWDKDLKSSMMYKERSLFSKEEIYLFGCLKNIISGSVWVQDHIPHSVNQDIIGNMPINIIDNIALSHEVSSYDLGWGDPKKEHQKAVEQNIPYITHIAEGYDDESRKGVQYLKEFQALSNHTVLVHGFQLSDNDIKDISKANSHLIWCPTANYFMFNDIAPINKWIEKGINISLGTDSPASGSLHLLDEIQKAHYLYKKYFGTPLDHKILFDMITKNPAKALKLDAGNLNEGAPANIVVTKKIVNNPYENISKLKLSDIALVIKEGIPIYGEKKFIHLFSYLNIKFNKIVVENEIRLLGSTPIYKLLKKVKSTVGYSKYLPFIPVNL